MTKQFLRLECACQDVDTSSLIFPHSSILQLHETGNHVSLHCSFIVWSDKHKTKSLCIHLQYNTDTVTPVTNAE